MEKENRCSMVRKIILGLFILLTSSSFVYSAVWWTLPNNKIMGGKSFKLVVTGNAPYIPYFLKSIRTVDDGATWFEDVLGAIVPPGGQFEQDAVNPVLGLDTLIVAYDYKPNITIPANDAIGIIAWYYLNGSCVSCTTGFLNVENPSGKGDEMIKLWDNPVRPGDFPVKITIKPVPSRGSPRIFVNIFDPFGYLVKDLSEGLIGNEFGSDSTYITVYWDGKNDKGFKVGNGAYQVCVKMTPTQGEEAVVWKKKFAVVR